MNNELRTMNDRNDCKTKRTNSHCFHSSVFSIHNSPPGFTLIEMLVTIVIFSLVALIGSGFLMTSLLGTKKAEINKEVRQNGAYALSVMEGMILNSRSVSCSADGKKIFLIDSENFSSNFECDETKGLIASNSAEQVFNLTAGNVKVSGCNFTCDGGDGRPARVNIDFTISQAASENLRPNEKSSLRLQSAVVTKNF